MRLGQIGPDYSCLRLGGRALFAMGFTRRIHKGGVAALVMMLSLFGAQTASAEAAYADFPAKMWDGQVVMPDFDGEQSEFDIFREPIQNGLIGKPQFAGSWRFVRDGCGSPCVVHLAVDQKTGTVLRVPADPGAIVTLYPRPDSRLLKFAEISWERNDPSEEEEVEEWQVCTISEFLLDEGKFKKLSHRVHERVADCKSGGI